MKLSTPVKGASSRGRPELRRRVSAPASAAPVASAPATASAPAVAAVPAPDEESLRSARAAGLRWVTDTMPGIRRERNGKGFRYIAPDGSEVTSSEEVSRLHHVAVPPAYTDVWLCPLPNGHIQATARDARGRKQYRYHPLWREVRDAVKYGRMVAFGEALGRVRERVDADLGREGLSRERVLAAVVRLLDVTHIRVGNDEYARANRSYGLTTMRSRHLDVHGTELVFTFRGKAGVEHRVRLRDRRLAGVLRRCQDVPGQELFQWVDAEGTRHPVGSDDVNDYIRDAAGGEDFTAKDFRTWAGTVLAYRELCRLEPAAGARQTKRRVGEAITAVARQLGNTPTVCRTCYVHPDVIAAYSDGALDGAASTSAAARTSAPPRPTPSPARAAATTRTAATATAATLQQAAAVVAPPAPAVGLGDDESAVLALLRSRVGPAKRHIARAAVGAEPPEAARRATGGPARAAATAPAGSGAPTGRRAGRRAR